MTYYNDKLYFYGTPDDLNYHLFESDFTYEGTKIIQPDVATISSPCTYSAEMAVHDGSLFFPAYFNTLGPQLWKYTTTYTSNNPMIDKDVTIEIFPNPVVNVLNINSLKVPEMIKVYNVKLQLMMTAESTNKLDLTAFQSGYYILEIHRGNGIERIRFIKE